MLAPGRRPLPLACGGQGSRSAPSVGSRCRSSVEARRQSSTTSDRFRTRHRPFSLGDGNRSICPTPAVRNTRPDRLNWVVSGPWHPGFPPSVIVPSTDLQVRCHGLELTDETCHFRAHAPQQDERSCTAIRSPRRRSQKRRWNVEAERLRHDQVNDEVELCRLLDRKIGGLRPQQDLADY